MKHHLATRTSFPRFAVPVSLWIGILTILAALSDPTYAVTDLVTFNQFIHGRVLGGDGAIFVMLPPGRVGLDDPFLNFYDKSFFTAKIGDTYFTNNSVLDIHLANTKKLGPPDELLKIGDTVRCIWKKRGGVDIIQDCWTFRFSKSGQVVIRWSFKNLDPKVVTSVQCQWLNDLDISDAHEPRQPNANDGPVLLHQYGYYDKWQQYPDSVNATVPEFYAGFLFDLPGPGNNPPPGLSCMGYLGDETIGTTKPLRITIGDWYTMASNVFGPPANYNTLAGKQPGPDGAILIEFPPTTVADTNTVVGGITSYGTAEFEECIGDLFGLLFYPHRIDWNAKTMTYSPSPFTVELYTVQPFQFGMAGNTQLTLTVCDHLSIWDSLGKTLIGKTQTKPTPGANLNGGQVLIEDFYVKADPVHYCTGDVTSCLKISGSSSLGDSTFLTPGFGDTCKHDITLGCAETDTLPPLLDVFVYPEFGRTDSIIVHDDRIVDKGLQSISWSIESGGPASKFKIDTLDPIHSCYTDKGRHRITIRQLDSTVYAYIRLHAVDCLGHSVDSTIYINPHPFSIPDTLAPSFSNKANSDSSVISVSVLDGNSYDKGLDTITWTFSSTNAEANTIVSWPPPTTPCTHNTQIVTLRQKVPELGDSVYFVFTDCAGNISRDTVAIPAPGLGTPGDLAPHFGIDAIRPNPIEDLATVDYSLPATGPVVLEVIDILGKTVATLANNVEAPGSQTAHFDARKLVAGTYIIRLNFAGKVCSATAKIVGH